MLISVLLAIILVFAYSCDHRVANPSEDEEEQVKEYIEPPIISLAVHPSHKVDAQVDTVALVVHLTDAQNNLIELSKSVTEQIHFKSNHGTIANSFGVFPESPFIYFFPNSIDTALNDIVTIDFTYNDNADTVRDSIELVVTPRLSAIGQLRPARINVSVRTDTVYKSGAGWKMLVDAHVSDTLGNPVVDDIPVLFTFVETKNLDTNLISLNNLAYTGEPCDLGDDCGSIAGEAISILTFDSRAISDTIVIRGTVDDGSGISSIDTLVIPLPVHGLKLKLHDRNGGVLYVKQGEDAISNVLVTLRDAFNVPIPGKTINVTPSGGILLPNCKVVNTNGKVIGSEPCEFLAEEERDTLYNPFSGITDSNGEFRIRIRIAYQDLQDPEMLYQSISIEVEENETHVMNTDFSFQVTFLEE